MIKESAQQILITEKLLKEYGFRKMEYSVEYKGEGSWCTNINMSYWAKEGVLLFYNESEIIDHKKWPGVHKMAWLGGFGFYHEGQYFAATFQWIYYWEQLERLYLALTHKELTK